MRPDDGNRAPRTDEDAPTPRVAGTSHPGSDLNRTSIGIGVAVLLVLGGVSFFLVSRGPDSGGPLEPPNVTSLETIPADVGDRVSYGFPLFGNQGPGSVILKEVVLDVPDGLRLLGVGVQVASENGSFLGSERSYPPDGYRLHPVRGWRVPPSLHSPVGIVVGLVAEREGRFLVPSVELWYEADGEEYLDTYQTGVLICAPARPVASCHAP